MLTRLKVRIVPNARRNEIASISQEEVRLKVHAPAQDGKANAELVRFLSESVGCPRSDIAIIRGEKARDKVIEIAGVSVEEVWERLRRRKQEARS
jgi:uncharacterized protein (TIGR00251 family)